MKIGFRDKKETLYIHELNIKRLKQKSSWE